MLLFGWSEVFFSSSSSFKQNKRDKSIAIKFTTGVLIETNFDCNKEKWKWIKFFVNVVLGKKVFFFLILSQNNKDDQWIDTIIREELAIVYSSFEY